MTSQFTRLRLAIAGGGTGGHVQPALSVVGVLRQRDALEDAIWIGSGDGVEREAAERAGIRFVAIPTGKFRRYFSLLNFTDAVRVPLGVVIARRALRAFQPDVVLSTGGFVSVPTVVAARGIAPVITHEQTATIGLANRVNARFADALAVSFAPSEPAARALHRTVLVTGNPVRSELLTGDRARGLQRFGFDPGIPVVYVTGGARGSTPINQRIAALLPDLLEQTQIIHQTGALGANADAAAQRAQRDTMPTRLARRYQILDLVRDELPDVYAASDLVIGRAGAGTVAELAYVGLPAIFIPLPGAGGDEQSMNARVLEGAGAAVIVPQHEATPERLREEIGRLLGDPQQRARMAVAAKSAARPDAADRLADALTVLAAGERINCR
jgi:UDP-N-acetylglucosamine--N-acetylmuramyl-(pentapeptide) pyrophosphoryl-undecaprenol N-acetylglucosamine transferase